jgi:hypothetical protein
MGIIPIYKAAKPWIATFPSILPISDINPISQGLMLHGKRTVRTLPQYFRHGYGYVALTAGSDRFSLIVAAQEIDITQSNSRYS